MNTSLSSIVIIRLTQKEGKEGNEGKVVKKGAQGLDPQVQFLTRAAIYSMPNPVLNS